MYRLVSILLSLEKKSHDDDDEVGGETLLELVKRVSASTGILAVIAQALKYVSAVYCIWTLYNSTLISAFIETTGILTHYCYRYILY